MFQMNDLEKASSQLHILILHFYYHICYIIDTKISIIMYYYLESVTFWRFYDPSNAQECTCWCFFLYLPDVSIRLYELAWRSNGSIKCQTLEFWNFQAVSHKNSVGIPGVNIWKHSRILMEFNWNTGGALSPILSKFTICFPELFRWNTSHFLAERTGILEDFLWYFDGAFVVFSRI